jgi:hypothetical protein
MVEEDVYDIVVVPTQLAQSVPRTCDSPPPRSRFCPTVVAKYTQQEWYESVQEENQVIIDRDRYVMAAFHAGAKAQRARERACEAKDEATKAARAAKAAEHRAVLLIEATEVAAKEELAAAQLSCDTQGAEGAKQFKQWYAQWQRRNHWFLTK